MKNLLYFFDNIIGKKIVVIGLTNITESICRMLPWDVSYIIDAERKFVGNTLLNKPIFPLEILTQEDTAKIAIIIAGSYNIFLEQILAVLNLERNVHYWYGVSLLEWYYYVKTNNCISNDPLNIVMMDGGLGSQMTQYGIGLLLKEKLNVNVKYDISWYEIAGKDIIGKENRKFCLTNVFDIDDFDIATEEEIKTYKAFHYYHHSKIFLYDEKLLSKKCNRYIGGYFSNFSYLAMVMDQLKKKFVFKISLNEENLKYLKQIQSAGTPIAIHVRRGDYVGSLFDILTVDYYKRATNLLAKKLSSAFIHFFVFSNDMQWVRNNLPTEYPITYIDCNDNDNGVFDMYLMSQCQHFIVANSGFSIWPAILGNSPDKIVIAPNKLCNIYVPNAPPDFVESAEGYEKGLHLPLDWIKLPV